ncbi:L,D-transpeptidase [Kribbella deserti]|uniref:L,D-transpeptidase n=1 Tax=Kribbella deserti TaxID=1926257 RepID=A0ABV6QSD0_9ACTN
MLVLLGGVAAAALFGGEDVDLSTLASSTTHATISLAPQDSKPFAATDGLVVHPQEEMAVYTAPDAKAFAKIGPRQFGPTWLPVIDRADGWVRVLLPSRPNRSTGWLKDRDLERATSPYVIRVHTGSRTIELLHKGRRQGIWRVAVGARKTPTPPGRTFVLGSITDERQSYSPVILPLGSHSPTLDTFGGGPGTVAIHGWPRSNVFGAAVSHGCIRVPDGALDRLRRVPLGTLVLIDSK